MFAIFVVIVEMILSHRSRRVSNLRKKSPDGHCLTGAFLYWNQWAGLFGHKGIESLGFRGHLTLDFPDVIRGDLNALQAKYDELTKPDIEAFKSPAAQAQMKKTLEARLGDIRTAVEQFSFPQKKLTTAD